MFTGDRVSLRAVEASDAPELHGILNHADLAGRRYVADERGPISLAFVEKKLTSWLDDERTQHFAITNGGEMVGLAQLETGWDPLTPFISVVIAPQQQRAGLGSETAELLLRHVFMHLPAQTVHSWIIEWNTAGLRFAEGLGFTVAGRLRREAIKDGRFVDAIAVELLRADWEAGHAD